MMKWDNMNKKQKAYFLNKWGYSQKYVDMDHRSLMHGMQKKLESHKCHMHRRKK